MEICVAVLVINRLSIIAIFAAILVINLMSPNPTSCITRFGFLYASNESPSQIMHTVTVYMHQIFGQVINRLRVLGSGHRTPPPNFFGSILPPPPPVASPLITLTLYGYRRYISCLLRLIYLFRDIFRLASQLFNK